jgi:cell division inhibitor SepF
MSKKLLDRVLGSLGFAEEIEDEEPKAAQEKDETDVKPKKSGTVVNIHTSQKQLKVIVIEPLCFDEVQTIADHLRNRKPVIINLEQTEKDVAKRIVDFMSGTTYAVGGNMQKVGHNIFLFVPANVDIAMDQRDELDRSVFSWANSR